jgi:hypothetical protein
VKQFPAEGADAGPCDIDLDAWRGDLRRLHLTIDQVVQGFIANQTRQLDAVASELSAQQERILTKELSFVQLSHSIAGFVEAEAARTELWGLPVADTEADALHEAYDAELPGPPALHRINRLWRKMTRAFEVMKEAKDREASKMLGDERLRLEARLETAEHRCTVLQCEHAAEMDLLRLQLQSVEGVGQEKESELTALTAELNSMMEQRQAVDAQLADVTQQLEQKGAAHNIAGYEWEVEREELIRERYTAQADVEGLQKAVAESRDREADLLRQYTDRGDKLEQMKRIMDEQEHEMTVKLDRVQQYVKERQAGALVAEKKQLDAERMADRWQREVQRLQTEKDRLAGAVLGLETHKSGQAQSMQGAHEMHQQEISRLQEALQHKEEQLRADNIESLQKLDVEYQTKINAERQREKDRSIALLNKKQQELSIKDQQLKAARQRIQELENGTPCHGTASPSSRNSTSGRRPSGDGCEASLPPLPLSAR